MDQDRQDYDDVAWDLNDDAWEESEKRLRLSSHCALVVSLVEQKFRKPATLIAPLRIGGFNVLYRVRVEHLASDVLVRLPCPNLAQFPDEKTVQEAATAMFLRQNTGIPVPRLFHYDDESEVGPYLVLQYVENHGDMVDALSIPGLDPSAPPILHDDIPETTLELLYYRMARCLVQLSRPRFPRIGSLAETDGALTVSGRPLTLNMNNMLQLANIPHAVLPPRGTTYGTADQWYVSLAEMHMAQLVFQHNDLVCSADDCRNKYVARQLFRRLAKQERLSTFGFAEDSWSAQSQKATPSTCRAPDRSGSFRLWCDDLRPTSFLLDAADDIVAAIDWEFAYAAPAQFALDPPWWLLLEMPEMWPHGIDDWARVFERRLETWLRSVDKAEQDDDTGSVSSSPVKLSEYMRESWVTGRFWLSYAARKSWALDTVFWKFLDQRFFGPRDQDGALWEARVHLLSEAERAAMEPFVERKMAESKERILVNWDPADAKACLSQVLLEE